MKQRRDDGDSTALVVVAAGLVVGIVAAFASQRVGLPNLPGLPGPTPPPGPPVHRAFKLTSIDPDALMKFAQQAGVGVDQIPELQAANPDKDLAKLKVGDVLRIPDSWPDRPGLYDVAPVSLPAPGTPAPAPGAEAPSPPPPAASLPRAVITPKVTDQARPARIKSVGDSLRAIWPDMVGGEMPPQALEIALAQAGHEGRWGYGWGEDMKGSHNLGGYQCGGASGSPYFTCVDHHDSRPNADGTQTSYAVKFRFYKDGVTPDGKSRSAADAAAWDFLNSITSPQKFDLSGPLKSGDVLEYARQGYNHHYFESFNLTQAGTDAYANVIGELLKRGVYLYKSGKKLATSQADGTWKAEPGATIPPGSPSAVMVAGRVALYVHTLADYMPDVLAALGSTNGAANVPAESVAFKPAYVAKGAVNPTWHAPSGAPASTPAAPAAVAGASVIGGIGLTPREDVLRALRIAGVLS